MIIHLVAYDKNGVMGLNGNLPFTLPEDLLNFRSLTENSLILMGFKTYESILANNMKGKTDFLPGRKVVVLRSNAIKAEESQKTCPFSNVNFMAHGFFAAHLKDSNQEPLVVVGGASLYENYPASIVLATEVDTEVVVEEGDDVVKYPLFNREDFKRLAYPPATSAAGLTYRNVMYARG